jgi:ribosome-associated toxin RatA of RatAB toxin-antitoxin module
MVMVQALLTMVAALAATTVFASTAAAQHVDVAENAGVFRINASFTVPGTAQAVAAVLTDYERIPDFMPDVTSSQVLSRSEAGIVVEQEATARFMMFSKRVHLVLEVSEDGNIIRFRDRCARSFKTYEGAWILTQTNEHTAVAYQLSAKPSFDVPGFVLKRLLKRDAAVMIDRIKAEITRRADLRQ